MQFTKLNKDAGSNSITWNHNELPELEGTIVNCKQNVGQYGKTLWNVETPTGELYTVWESTVIKKLLSQVPIGSYIKLIFLGKKRNKTGSSSYNDYDLFVAAQEAKTIVDNGNSNLNQPTNNPMTPTNGYANNTDDNDDVPF